MDEIQEVKKHKINIEEIIKTLCQSIIHETIASETDHSYPVKAPSFAKTLIEKGKYIERPHYGPREIRG